MKRIFSTIAVVTLLLNGCATVGFPKSGTPSPYDGKWTGSLPSKSASCAAINLVAKGEVRYGYMIAEVFDGTMKKYDLWGQIAPDGTLKGNIGSAGVTGATASVRFNGNDANGTWTASQCDGTVALKRL